jgi:alkylated DNA repair dioxygenase AlkB
MNLFTSFSTPVRFSLWNAELLYFETFYTPQKADEILKNLEANLAWQQGEIQMFGKKILEPRLTAWYGDAGKTYTYSGKKQEPLNWVEPLLSINTDLKLALNTELASEKTHFFNSVLANFYRAGNDSMGWHSDDEPELGKNPIIASLSLGETRRFLVRSKPKYKNDGTKPFEIALSHGSVLIMMGAMQHFWQHSIPKEPQKKQARINLTYRFIQ